MERALNLYRAGEQAAAIQSLDDSYNLADRQFKNSFFVHRIIWWEAQGHSGKEDEEWGLKMFRYLRDREHRLHPNHAIEIPGRDFVMFGNIIEKLENLGMLAQSRAETMDLENTLTKYLHMDLSCQSYPETGPLFEFLPEARKRNYPLYRRELPEHHDDCSLFVYYCYMYGVQYICNTARDTGDWERAAELADWFMQFNDAYALGKEAMKAEICRHALYATDTLADICLLHRYPEEAVEVYETFLQKMETGHYQASTNVYYKAQLNLARIQIQLGTLPDNAIQTAETGVASIEQWFHFDRCEIIHAKLSLARIYHARGGTDKAWAIVNTLFEETSLDVNTYHQLRILTTAIDLALDEGGLHPELEKWLVLALHNERQLGNKFNELPLYEKYAQFLEIHGRYDEARSIRNEAIRLSRAMNLPRRTQQNQTALERYPSNPVAPQEEPLPIELSKETASIQKEIRSTNPEKAGAERDESPVSSGLSISAEIPVEIQPSLSLSIALPGQSAHGRFYLTNPAGNAQAGQVKIAGAVQQLHWQNEQWLTMQASPTFPTVSMSRPLKLQAGESCIIDITGLPTESGTGGTVRCSWMNGSKLISEGVWEYRSEETQKRTAVIDAHELRRNPFYLVPINHTIQRQESHAAEAVDFTVSASSPMRIEAYNGSTGKLLYVDANGDGDFEDAGDLISSDANHNNWPDILFNAGDRMAALTLYVKAEPNAAEEQELTIQLLENGTWRIDAIDVIK
ncbi:MAG: hypothetical protein DRP64_01980 [Verrucomicrobia bacterium]|nr:MAG: hypothetical protein DRP64_01980 [Verrucomicrobiota bacterium]